MKRILRSTTPAVSVTNEQLVRLAQFISGRLHLRCPRCQNYRRMTVEFGDILLGKNPPGTHVEEKRAGAPRLLIRCSGCNNYFGHVQGDEWVTSEEISEEDGATRWDYLEFEDDTEQESTSGE